MWNKKIMIIIFFFSIYALDKYCLNRSELTNNECENLSEFECSVEIQCSLMNAQDIEDKCFLKNLCASYSHMPAYPCTLSNIGDYCFNSCELFNKFYLNNYELEGSFENSPCYLMDGNCVSNPCVGFTGPNCPNGCLIMRDQDMCIPDGCASINLENNCKESGMGCDIHRSNDGNINCRYCLKIV
jgi:hypothetical protein